MAEIFSNEQKSSKKNQGIIDDEQGRAFQESRDIAHYHHKNRRGDALQNGNKA
jgi:hypothetical protein